MRSSAGHLALATIAKRTGVDDTSSVLLAAFAVSLARVSDVRPSVVRTVVNNRFRAGFAESVSAVNQSGLCVIDVADASFDEVVGRAWRSAVGAGLHAYYDPHELHRLFDSVGRERGVRLDMSCFFNDTRRVGVDQSEAAATPSELDEALHHSEFRWGQRAR